MSFQIDFYFLNTKHIGQVVTLLTCIQELPGSNFGQDTDCFDSCVL